RGRSTGRSTSPTRGRRRRSSWSPLRGSAGRLGPVGPDAAAEGEQDTQGRQDRREDAPQRRARDRPARHLRRGRQAGYLRLVHQQVEGIEAAEDVLIGSVEAGLGNALAFQLGEAAAGAAL